MTAFLICFLTGFVMCIPVGPINIWVMNICLKKGAVKARALALGGTVMDFIYFLIILSGLSILDISNTSWSYLKVGGIALIFIFGIKELCTRPKFISVDLGRARKSSLLGYAGLGALLYLSNPVLVLTMSSLGAFIKSLDVFEMTLGNIVLGSLGLSGGAFSWFFLLTLLVLHYQEQLRGKYLGVFNRVSGSLMIGLSLFMGYRLFLID